MNQPPHKKKENPLAAYRDKRRNLCGGCEFADYDSLQKVSICRNCVVKAIHKGDYEPEPEEVF